MASAEPPTNVWPARTNPGQPTFQPALRTAGRVLAAVAGMAIGAAMLVIDGLYALFTTCIDYDGETAVCGNLGALVGPLELFAVLGGAAAAVAGGIGTAATGRARWIGCGFAITFVLVLLLMVLVDVQQPALN